MKPIIIPSPSIHPLVAPPQPPNKPLKSGSQSRLSSFSSSRDPNTSWGRRHHHGSWLNATGCLGIMILCPLLVIYYWIALSFFNGSLLQAGTAMLEMGPLAFFRWFAPRPDWRVSISYGGWLAFQAAMYCFLPSTISTGQLTPAGNLLEYRTNGLSAWFATHVVFAVSVLYGAVDPAIIAKNWEALLIAANIYGFLLSGTAYVKAYLSPTYEGDCKFSGSWFYDFYMGIELNPRFGRSFDFKLFHNGRPGIIAWTLVDLSFIAYQYQLYGFVTNSILLATALHAIYVVDFFINEDWYLRTIDICHDHFGFYLAWGSMVWLPCMYTLQSQYLARNPVILSPYYTAAVFLAGVTGYTIFRSVNHQKDLARRTNGQCQIWSSPARVIRVKYTTKDGLEHSSLLLCSGWWGLARHVNYLGDLVLSYSMCATCGFKNLLPWTYAIFMTVLLVHRSQRDEERCSKKYGKHWDEYCKKVRWVIIPGIY